MAPDADVTAPAALATRPDARTFSVEDLVGAVRNGRIRVPKFQRPMKWEVEDALELLDSIYRGFPVGMLLLWQRPAEAERIVHGSVVIDAPARADALWVVDGQQRIVSLTRVLAGAGFPDEPFAAFFDLLSERFVRPKAREVVPRHFIPLTEVLDSERLMLWLVSHHDAAGDPRRMARLGKRLREFLLPAYIVVTEDEAIVREVFRRANNTGKKMEASEVFNALHGARSPATPASLREVAAALVEFGFGAIDEGVLHDMLLATCGTDLTPVDADQALLDTERVARSAIAFLRHTAGIPHISLLPYTQPLLALARFFHRHPEPHPRTLELLARWIWRGALTGAHDGDAVGTWRMLAAVGDDEHASVQRLLAMLPGRPSSPLALEDFSFAYARCKIQVLALLELRPLDVRTGAPVRSDASGDDVQKLLHVICPDPAEFQSSLANRMLHPGVRTGLARALGACGDRTILTSQVVSDEARWALADGDEATFLRKRGALLQEVVQRFTAQRAQWDEHDRPPIEAMIVEDD